MWTRQRCARRKDTQEIGWRPRRHRWLESFFGAIFAAALGLAAPAQAETITGTFQYLDRDRNFSGTITTRTVRPIAGATVEVYECAPGASCGWSLAATTSTNAAGAISVSVTRAQDSRGRRPSRGSATACPSPGDVSVELHLLPAAATCLVSLGGPGAP